LISNLVAPKICKFGPFEVSGALLLFPLTYIFGDIFTEVYGYAGSRRAIWIGFSASALLAIMSKLIVLAPAAPGWPNQAAYSTVFDFVPRIVIASLIAFWAGEFANSYVMAKMKVLTEGRHLWTRTVGSTVVGQAIDTGLVIVLTFAGNESWGRIANLIISGYLAKVIYEAVMTPFTYLVVNALKRAEGIDLFDVGTNFNPFGKEESPASQSAEVVSKS
jgi:queuosine precursor transporter